MKSDSVWSQTAQVESRPDLPECRTHSVSYRQDKQLCCVVSLTKIVFC